MATRDEPTARGSRPSRSAMPKKHLDFIRSPGYATL
jgi:hypothetical protein